MKRLYFHLLWLLYWKGRAPKSGLEMRRKLVVYCGRRPPYTKEELS